MPNPVLVGVKLKMKRDALSTVEGKLTELLAKRSEFESAVEAAESEDDLTAIENSMNENDEEIKTKEEEKTKLEEEIEELEKELERSNDKKPKNRSKLGGKGKMDKEQLQELRSAINTYIRSKGAEIRAVEGFKVVDGGALVPEELLTPEKAVEDVVDLLSYVKKVPVKRGSGKYPVIKKSGSKMNTVAELEANPELAKPSVSDVAYDIETYRGYIPVSQEVIDDADYDIVGLIDEEIRDQELNTRNAAIATVLKSATPKTVSSLDEIITLLNTGFKTAYQVKLYVSQSFFNDLDLMKDGNGRYLLQDDVTVASGKRLKGKEIVVLDDDMIGTSAGDKVAFIGDAKAFCKFFDRKQVSVKWVDNNIYGQMLAGFVRFDVKKADAEAGYYITYTSGTTTPEV
ncbi:phage major capsid protein [Heyndrickxia sp. FSL W8-0496]|uniref:phage major capsid protein n=1 Tax=Heyndrickxia TaxID=2837504 RepID=UPI001C0F21F8|nr:phage major capsid protein [Heyndrickxia oleronia]MBU5214981.1 phage major capsid protein [Heyndrickxia oleronia]